MKSDSQLIGNVYGYGLARGFRAGFFAAGEALERAAQSRRLKLPFKLGDVLKRVVEEEGRKFGEKEKKEAEAWK